MIQIDGSEGEAGGQILRTSLSLALVTQQAFRMINIRAGREKPGLLRQHLSAVLAAAEIGDASVEGAELRSSTLTFKPKPVRAGEYRFVIGTAGSSTLVLQTLLPALMTASGPSRITVEGGTHNQCAPPFDYLDRCFLPFVNRMGPQVHLRLERYGFYPAGGGCIHAEIQPCTKLAAFHTTERGPVLTKRAVALIANLPGHIAERELETVRGIMGADVETKILGTKNSPGPGNVVMIEVSSEQATEIFTSFGQIGVTAENVARQAVSEAREYLACSAVAGEHLTDQLLLPMALAGGGSFTALKLSQHAQTNMDVIRRFVDVQFRTEATEKFVTVAI